MTEEADAPLMSGLPKKTSVAKADWQQATTECVVEIQKV